MKYKGRKSTANLKISTSDRVYFSWNFIKKVFFFLGKFINQLKYNYNNPEFYVAKKIRTFDTWGIAIIPGSLSIGVQQYKSPVILNGV